MRGEPRAIRRLTSWQGRRVSQAIVAAALAMAVLASCGGEEVPAAAERERCDPSEPKFVELRPGELQVTPGAPTTACAVWMQARIFPAIRDGKAVGITVSSIRPDSLYVKAGLQPGDTVLRANGLSLGGPDHLLEVSARLRDETVITLDVERAGRVIQLRYHLMERSPEEEARCGTTSATEAYE